MLRSLARRFSIGVDVSINCRLEGIEVGSLNAGFFRPITESEGRVGTLLVELLVGVVVLMVYRFEESHHLGSVEYDIFAARISAIAILSIALA